MFQKPIVVNIGIYDLSVLNRSATYTPHGIRNQRLKAEHKSYYTNYKNAYQLVCLGGGEFAPSRKTWHKIKDITDFMH